MKFHESAVALRSDALDALRLFRRRLNPSHLHDVVAHGMGDNAPGGVAVVVRNDANGVALPCFQFKNTANAASVVAYCVGDVGIHGKT